MRFNDSKTVNIILCAVLVFSLGLILLFRSGILDADPEVEIRPDNCYADTLYVITDADYRPYSFRDAAGSYSGHDVELIASVANLLQMNLDLKLMSWNDAIEATLAGQGDVLMTCDYSDSFPGVEKLLKSEPVSTDEFIIYSRTKITSSDVLYGKRIAVMQNGNVTAEIRKMNLGKYCILYDDNREAMRALINGEVDYAVMRQTVGTVLLSELNAKGIEGYVSLGRSDMCFCVRSDEPELAGRINEALEELKMNGEMERLQKKWLTTFVEPYTFWEVLTNNIWVVVIFTVLLLMALAAFARNSVQKRKSEEQELRNAQIIEQLGQDFVCVNYVELTDEPKKDPVVNYRVSRELSELIPGWESEKMFGRKLELLQENLVYEEDREAFAEAVLRDRVVAAFREADVYFVNVRLFQEGEIRYYQMKFSPVYENGRLKGMVFGLHSVDAQTRKEMALQDQLQEALKDAEAANRSKSDFLFNMSHDIRTPMNAIMGFTTMAKKRIDDKEKVLDCLQKTQQSGSLLLSLINSILEVSRIESGKAAPEETLADVSHCFTAVEETMKELAMMRDISLSFEIGEIRDRYVYCDVNRCNRIFVNIISNAIKYSNQGGNVRVRCDEVGRTENGRGLYRFVFEDDGIGMSEEFQRHVFDRFSREESTTASGVQGTGLGMAVVKSFVDLMEGSIECKSRIGEGTVFTVTLPLRIREGDDPGDPGFRETEEFTAPEHAFAGKRVLLVEDNDFNREIATDILEEAKITVESARNGREAVDLLREKGPDFVEYILMDIQMPLMNGYEATRAIREMYPDRHIPIIALSANAFAEDKASSLAAGMDEHVAKPIDIRKLFAALRKFR